MKKLLHGLARPNTFAPLLFLSALLFLVASQIVPQNTLAIVINGIFIAVCIMIIAAYSPTLVRTLRSDVELKEQFLVSGILLLWLSIAASRMWSLAIIMAGKPDWMINHWFQTFCYLAAAASGFYFLQVPGRSQVGFKYTTAALMIAVAIITAALALFEY